MQKPKSTGSKTRRSKPTDPTPPAAPAAARKEAEKAASPATPKTPVKAPAEARAKEPPKAPDKGRVTSAAPVEGAGRKGGQAEGRSPGGKASVSGGTAVPAPPPAPAAPLPPILLEGDVDRAPGVGGPGDRYVTGPVPAKAGAGAGAAAALPSAYGTGRMLLLARDPYWIYAHWDLTDEQLRDYNRKSASGHLTVRVYGDALEGKPLVEQEVHPESRNWFVHVPRAGARYVAELGYYGRREVWTRIAASAATLTPTDTMSPEVWARFETLPFDIPMATLVAMVREAAGEHVPLVEALGRVRDRGGIPWPSAEAVARREWTVEQERALARAISIDEMRRVWIGSLEITELVRRQLARGISSGEWPVSSLGAEAISSVSSVSSLASPFGGAGEVRRGFWFNVNAELIVYGATDPGATVRIGDRTIRLRPDGTFSYRFALPDGDYALPIRATSPDEVETRSASLTFRRASEYRGDVGRHPQDGALRTPGPEHVA